MACNKKYNGWTNYATWAVALWIDNEEAIYKFWRQNARDLLKKIKKSDAIHELANMLREAHLNDNPLSEARGSVYSDLMNFALGEINWQEVAKSRFDE